MADWKPIETAPKDGTIVIVGKMTTSQVVPSWPIQARFLAGRWSARFNDDEWRPFDPQPTHWKPHPQPEEEP